MSQNWPPTRGVRNNDFVNSVGVATPCSSALGPRAPCWRPLYRRGGCARADRGQRKTAHANRKTLKLHPNIDLVVAEMGPFRRGLLSMYSHHGSYRESQSLAQQKDSLHRIAYTERRDCDRISNDAVMLIQ